MLSRRRVLLGFTTAAIGAWGSSGHALVRMLGWSSASSQAAGTQPTDTENPENAAVDDRLRQDLARIASRADSEEGVPVILACEDWFAEQTSHRAAPAQLTLFNLAFASELRTNAAAWERLRPNPAETDVATLVQILAYRDFDSGRLEQRP